MMATMSLRRRLLLVLFMAAVSLGAAGYAIRQVVSRSQAGRERGGLATAQTLARSAARGGVREQSVRDLRALLGTIPDASVGTCNPAGELGAFAANGGWGEAVGRPPPPDVRGAIAGACRAAGQPRDLRVPHPHDVMLVAAADGYDGARSWAVIRVQADTDSRRDWLWPVVILAVATLVLSLITLDALGALQRGTAQLRQGLVRLESDLRAPVVRPRADELGRVADGLTTMAAHLASAQERERALERKLGHQQRLAALGRVVAGLAHEVRNPLAGLKLRLDIARRSAGVPREVLAEVSGSLDEIARLDRLVVSLLALGRPSEQRTPFDVGALADERLGLLGPWAAGRQVSLRRAGTAAVRADRDALARVIDNLVRNAVEASPAGEVRLELAEREGALTLAVSDRGPGAPAPAQLFEPFSSTKPDGTGLGLFVARSLIEAMGGTISYVREPPWTSFLISLPTS